jgi:hypothetical protein
VNEAGSGHLEEHATGIIREPLGQLGSFLTVELTSRLEEVSAVQNSSNHVPLGQSQRVIPYSVEDAAVYLSFRLGAGGACGTMAELGRAVGGGGPLFQLRRCGIPKRIVQPDCA